MKDVVDGMTDREKAHAVIGSIERTTPREYFERSQGTMVAEPVAGRMVGRRINDAGHRDDYNEGIPHNQRLEVNDNPDKTNCLTTVLKDNVIIQPVQVGSMPRPSGELSTSQAMRVYDIDGKSVGLKANGGGMGGKTGLYAVPMRVKECSRKANTDVYEVRNGRVAIKDKEYPIKLKDGHYVIRKLTVDECKRLQTVPDDYDMSVISNTQAYKCLGNGWTVEVIAHLITGALADSSDCSNRTPKQCALDRYFD